MTQRGLISSTQTLNVLLNPVKLLAEVHMHNSSNQLDLFYSKLCTRDIQHLKVDKDMSGRKCHGDGASQTCPQNNTFDSMFQHLHIKDEWNYVIFIMIDVIIAAYRIHHHEYMILEYHIFLNLKAD